MNAPRKLLSFLLALAMLLTMTPAVCAAKTSDAEACMAKMLNYYVYHQEKAETDIARLNAQLAQLDPELAKTWDNIMDYWAWVNQEMEVPLGILPDGLPEDDSLCIVVLGYALKSNGSMKNELVSRLKVALASAEKYPNAYILCTGGGTASRSKSKTEAGQMAAWLREQGIPSERIIVEDKSLSTIQNAQFSSKILASDYPQVRHLALISSDYHVPWASVFFNTQMAIAGYEAGTEPLDLIANAGCEIESDSSASLSYLASGIAQLAGIHYEAEKPKLSKLTRLEVEGDFTYETGTAMSLTATAYYDTGFSKDVTASAVFSGVDMSLSGEQLLTVTYTENGIEVITRLLIDVVSNSILEEVDAEIVEIAEPEEAPTIAAAAAVVPAVASTPPIYPFLLLAALLALLALLIRLKILNNTRR